MGSKSIRNIYRQLSKLKIYSLKQNSLVDAELAAYGIAFKWIEDKIAKLKSKAYVETCSEGDLHLHESLLGINKRLESDFEARKAMIVYRNSITPCDFTLQGIEKAIYSTGIKALVTEGYDDECLVIKIEKFIDPFLSLDSVKRALEKVLPAHLDWRIEAM